MTDDLLRGASNAFDPMAVAGAAHQDGAADARNDLVHQLIDLCRAVRLCRAPVVRVFRTHPFTVSVQDLMQKRAKVIALKLIDIALLETETVHCKVAERTLTKGLKTCRTAADPPVTRKQLLCRRQRQLLLLTRR